MTICGLDPSFPFLAPPKHNTIADVYNIIPRHHKPLRTILEVTESSLSSAKAFVPGNEDNVMVSTRATQMT